MTEGRYLQIKLGGLELLNEFIKLPKTRRAQMNYAIIKLLLSVYDLGYADGKGKPELQRQPNSRL
jgi:hypothetical protein